MKKAPLQCIIRHEFIGSLNKNRYELTELPISDLTQLLTEAKTLECTFGIAVIMLENVIDEKRGHKSGKTRSANPER